MSKALCRIFFYCIWTMCLTLVLGRKIAGSLEHGAWSMELGACLIEIETSGVKVILNDKIFFTFYVKSVTLCLEVKQI